MAEIFYEEQRYACGEGETVLECLERNAIAVPSSCRSGVCQTCLMKSLDVAPPAAAQKGLKPTLQAQNYFLACLCVPTADMSVTRNGVEGLRAAATVHAIEMLNERIARLRVACDAIPDYRAGQFFNLCRPDGTVRSYSAASLPGTDQHLEFHVGLLPGGRMSGWVINEAQPGDTLELLGPQGQCFYVPGNPEQPLFLLGTGTGLAPLYGIARDALAQGHSGPIYLFHGSVQRPGLYLVEELQALSKSHENFHYCPCVLQGSTPDAVTGAIDSIALERIPDLKGWRVFLCGPPDLVKVMQRKCFMAGASMKEIYADAFLPSRAGAA